MSRLHLTPAAPVELGWMQEFLDAGVLSAVDVALGELVDQLLPDELKKKQRRMIVLAAALASRAPQRGHVAVDLRTIATTASVDTRVPTPARNAATPPAIDGLSWPDPETWTKFLAKVVKKSLAPGVLRNHEGMLPNVSRDLLVYRDGLVYTDRMYTYEDTVSQALNGLAQRSTPIPDLEIGAIEIAIDGLFPNGGRQADAARHAVYHRLTVIAGGPGTGKTYTITRILAALSAVKVPRIALAAPTGKAAGRMKEAIHAASEELEPQVAAALADIEASTIHRLLGYGDGIRFAHNKTRHLPYDVIVIDEVSMVSLPLMGRLVDAVGPDTRLVLVGDPYQLASVEAGAVLGDITGSGRFADATVVTLDVSRRFDDGSGIGMLARSIQAGDADRALDLLIDPAIADVGLVAPDDAASTLELVVDNGVRSLELAQENQAAAAMLANGAAKVLCATRRGPNGLDEWQKRIESGVRARMSGRAFQGRWYVGRPIIATANDYLLRLFNGDTGVVVQSENGARVVRFPDSNNDAPLQPAQLGEFDTWWAMTIHKSQGSEFEHAIVCLSEPDSPILTRELLYTGITRARDHVTVVATEAAIRQAVETPIRRASGLAGLLR